MTISGKHLKIITYLSRAALFSIVICILFFSLNEKLPLSFSYADKVLHMVGYFTITLLAILSWPHQRRRIAILTLLLGLCIEILQVFQPTRSFHLNDIAANIAGIIFAILLVWSVKRYLELSSASPVE